MIVSTTMSTSARPSVLTRIMSILKEENLELICKIYKICVKLMLLFLLIFLIFALKQFIVKLVQISPKPVDKEIRILCQPNLYLDSSFQPIVTEIIWENNNESRAHTLEVRNFSAVSDNPISFLKLKRKLKLLHVFDTHGLRELVGWLYRCFYLNKCEKTSGCLKLNFSPVQICDYIKKPYQAFYVNGVKLNDLFIRYFTKLYSELLGYKVW